MKIKPLNDKVLVELSNPSEIRSGIVLPETSEGNKIGTVIAIGDGRMEKGQRIPLNIEVGQKIIFSWGEKVELEGKEYHLVSEGSILGTIYE